MANNTNPAAQSTDVWAGVKPKDVLTDPEFYKLSKEARRLALSRIDPGFGQADASTQDMTLDAPINHWQDYFKPEAPPPEPGFMEKAWGKTKEIAGSALEMAKGAGEAISSGQARQAESRAMEVAPRAALAAELPAELAPPPEIDNLINEIRMRSFAEKSKRSKPAGEKVMAQAGKVPSQVDIKPLPAHAATKTAAGAQKSFKNQPGLIEPGNIDLSAQPSVYNAEAGGMSTVYSESHNINGKEVLLPRVTPDGRLLTSDQAVEEYEKTGRHLGIFDSAKAATDYSKKLHDDYETGKIKKPYDPFAGISGISAHKSAPLGLFDLAREIVSPEGMKRLPIMGGIVEGIELYDVLRAAKRINENKATPYDEELLGNWEAKEVERQARGESTAYKIANLVSYLPGFATEFALTGGLYTGGKKGAEKLILQAVKKVAKNRLARGGAARKAAYIATRGAGSAVGAAVQTAGMPQRIAAGAIERMVPSVSVEKDAEGEVSNVIRDEGDEFQVALARAIPDMFIEVASERTGAVIPSLSKHLSKLPYADRIKALKTAVISRWFKSKPDSNWSDFLTELKSKAGWNGVLGEMFEERVGEIARDVYGVTDPEEWSALTQLATGVSPIPDGSTASEIRRRAIQDLGEQLTIEGAAFSVPAIASKAMEYIPKKGISKAKIDELYKILDDLAAREPEAPEELPPDLTAEPIPAGPTQAGVETPAAGPDAEEAPEITEPGQESPTELPEDPDAAGATEKPAAGAPAREYKVTAESVGNAFQDAWLLRAPGGSMEITFGDSDVTIDQVRVDPESQGNGIASSMYRKLGEMMKERGIPGSAIKGNVQGDPEIIAKLRAKASEIAGEGVTSPDRYEISLDEEEAGVTEEAGATTELPGELTPEPFPEAPPVPTGSNPFTWQERVGTEPNGAPIDLTGKYVMTPRGIGVILQAEEDTPEGSIPVGFDRGEVENFGSQDILMLNQDDAIDYEWKYRLQEPPKGIKISDDSQYRGLDPKQLYLRLQRQQVEKLLEYKRAEYTPESGLPGWRPYQLRFLREQYDAGYEDISRAFGKDVAEKMQGTIEASIDRAIATPRPPHLEQGGLPRMTQYLGPNTEDGVPVSFTYIDEEIKEDGGTREEYKVTVGPAQNVSTAIEENRTQYSRNKEAKKESGEFIEDVSKKEPEAAATISTPKKEEEKKSGPLADYFETDATIDPKIFPALNRGLARAKELGIDDDIMLGLIAGQNRDEIAKDIIGKHTNQNIPDMATMRWLIQQIKQLKSIPNANSPAFAEWQKNALSIMKDWVRPGEAIAVIPTELTQEPTEKQPGFKAYVDNSSGETRRIIESPGGAKLIQGVDTNGNIYYEVEGDLKQLQRFVTINPDSTLSFNDNEIRNEFSRQGQKYLESGAIGITSNEAIGIEGQLPDELEKEPIATTAEESVTDSGKTIIEHVELESDRLAKAREKIRNRIGLRGPKGLPDVLPGSVPGRDELLNDPDIIDNILVIGSEYYNAGVIDKAKWHASIYAELEGIAEGLGDDLEALLPMTWYSVSGEESGYVGGKGGVYGATGIEEGGAGSEPTGLSTDAGQTGGAHGGIQPGAVEGFGALGESPEIPGGEIQPGETGIPGGEEGGAESEPSRGAGGARPLPTTGDGARTKGEFFKLTPEVGFGQGGWSPRRRINENMAALRLLKKLIEEEREPTEDEKIVLARFVGWGGVWQALDPSHRDFREEYRELLEMMSYEDFQAAQNSTKDAFYTAEPIARAMWDMAEHFGFHGNGLVLEGAAGVGVFLGTAPDHIADTSQFIGTEIEKYSAGIVGKLYPAAKIFNRGFETLEFPDNSLDLAITNVPFGTTIYDKRYRDLGAAIHDYYFLKTMDKLRPGGMMIYITSVYTMDKRNTAIRTALAAKGDLVTAIRLPNDTFMSNAGTGVATDIIVLQKRAPGQEASGESWANSEPYDVIDNKTGEEAKIHINEWFIRHPENIIGTMSRGSGLYSKSEPIVLMPAHGGIKPADIPNFIAGKISEAISNMPADIYSSDPYANPRNTAQFAERFSSGSVWEKQIIVNPETGDLQRKVNGFLYPIEKEISDDPDAVTMLKELIAIRESLWELFRVQLESNNDDLLGEAQKNLSTLYDGFIRKYQERLDKASKGKKGKKSKGKEFFSLNSRLIKALMGDDPTYYYLIALEDVNQDDGSVVKGRIFFDRVMRPAMKLETLPDDNRLAMSMISAHRGFLDIDLMADLRGVPVEDIERILREEKLAFKNPVTGVMELAEDYLSGDIYDKIDDAGKAVILDQSYSHNIDALTEAIPERIPINGPDLAKCFQPKMGAPWIDPVYIEAFIKHIFERRWMRVEVTQNEKGRYSVKYKKKNELSHHIQTQVWGMESAPASDLIELALNQKVPVVKMLVDAVDENGKTYKKEVKDPIASKKALVMQNRIKDEFSNFMRTAEFAPELEEKYNRIYNRVRLRQFDGSHVVLDGMNRAILRNGDLEPHQKNAVWRTIVDGRVMLAHFVGSGKSFCMAASAMEMRRLGLAKKILIGVPKDVYRQFAAEFARLYPGAKILVADEKDFQAKNRKKMFARITMDDWDAIIVSHEHVGMIPISPEREARTLYDEVEEIDELIKNTDGERNKTAKNTLKRLVKKKAKIEAKIAELMDIKQDDTIYFDKMGIDFLMIDEAHRYKNLPINTAMGNIAGISGSSSKRALALKSKTDFLIERNNGRGVLFATGTPVSNSMVELYNFNKYLDPVGLETARAKYFDSWAGNFGQTAVIMGISPDGKSIRPQTVFAQFTNLPELSLMFRKYADVVRREDLRLPIPTLMNDSVTIHSLPISAEQSAYFEKIKERLEYIDKNPGHDRTVDNILKVNGDAKKASIDMRLVDGNASDDEGSKANTAVRMMASYYHQYAETKRSQVLFTDNFHNNATGFNLLEDMKKKLIAAGVAESEIAIIHDYSKKEAPELYRKLNEGEIRILLTTKRTAEGANMQQRLGRLYHLDAPWTPKDIEQREGRILRQGNLHYQWGESVEIVQFVTENTLDARLFEILRRKAAFIRQYLVGDTDARSAKDPSAKVVVTFEMISAVASGNPDYIRKVELEDEVAGLQLLYEHHRAGQRRISYDIQGIDGNIDKAKARQAESDTITANYQKYREPFSVKLDGEVFTDPQKAIDAVRKRAAEGVPNPKIEEGKPLQPGEPDMVPYRPKISGRYVTVDEAIEHITHASIAENRPHGFDAVIDGKRYQDKAAAEEFITKELERVWEEEGRHVLDFMIYGFNARLTYIRRKEHKVNVAGGYVTQGEIRSLNLNILQKDIAVMDKKEVVFKAITHLRNAKNKSEQEAAYIANLEEEKAKLLADIGKEFPGQEKLDQLKIELGEVNARLGIKDDSAISDDESGIEEGQLKEKQDPDELSDSDDEEDEEDPDDAESDRYADELAPYREISVPGTHKPVITGDNAPDNPEDILSDETSQSVISNLPPLPMEAESGPAFMYAQPAEQADIASLDSGTVPQSIIDNLDTMANRRLAMVSSVNIVARGSEWEISDGITIFRARLNNNSIEVWEAMGYGRLKIPELLYMIEQITGSPAGISRKMRKALGQMVPDGHGGLVEIRADLFHELKDREQLARTLAHEIGHAIDYAPDNLMKRGNLIGRLLTLFKFAKETHPDLGREIKNKNLRTELIALSAHWRPWDRASAPQWYVRYRDSAEELYADFISCMLNSPGTAYRIAPQTYRAWHRELDRKPDVKKAYYQLREMMVGTPEDMIEHRLQRFGVMLQDSEAIEIAQEMEKNTRSYGAWGGLRTWFDDIRWEHNQRVRESMKAGVYSPVDDSNALYLWNQLPLKQITDFYRFTEKVNNEVVKALKAADISMIDFGTYLTLIRSAFERKNIASPIVGTSEAAAETLEGFKAKLGKDKADELVRISDHFHDLYWVVIEAAQDAGIYSQSMVENVFEPAKYTYGKFTAQEYISQWVSPHTYRQAGFVGPIANPFIETMKLAQSVLRLAALNRAKKASIDYLKQVHPEEIKKATMINRGQPGRPQWEPSPHGYDVVEVMVDGKVLGYHVDKYIADSLNTTSSYEVEGVGKWLQAFHHKFFWKVTILYNLGFAGWGNPIRDFWTNYRMLPLKGAIVGDLFQLLSSYKNAAPHAWKWLHAQESAPGWGWLPKYSKKDAAVEEMIDSYSFGMPLTDIMAAETDSFSYVMQRAGLYSDTGMIKKGRGARAIYNITGCIGAPMRFLSQFTEITGKLAGRQIRQAAGESGERLAFNVRNFTSTPNYTVKGKLTNYSNVIMPFSNIAKEGWKREYLMATDPTTRSGYWWRTSKVLFLKFLTIIAEMGLLDYLFGDEIEDRYKAISKYFKNNYLTIPLGGSNKSGKIPFLALPEDEMTRVLGGVMRYALISARKDNPAEWENFVKWLRSNLLPSLSPAISIPMTWADFESGINVMDDFRQSPILSDTVRKARDYRARMRMVEWTINELGLGQYATYDDTTKTKYEVWTQMDPTLGKWAGRIVRFSNYGLDEAKKEDVTLREMQEARETLDAHNLTPSIKKFFDTRRTISRDHELLSERIREGEEYDDLVSIYPDAIWHSIYSKTSAALLDMRKAVAAIEKSKTLTDKEKAQKIQNLQDKMNELAEMALTKSGRMQPTELPDELTNPPETK